MNPMNRKIIKIGTRESRLALVQSEMVKTYIEKHHPDTMVELVPMKTTGDKILDRTLDKVGGKGLFVKELDRALREKRSDISVHSLKDVPMEAPEDLPLLGFSCREDARDVLVMPEGETQLKETLPIGCSSRRRILQMKKMYPHMTFASARGNVQTRLRKLDEGNYSALILAAAGLKRLGLEHRISRYFSVDEMIPAAGQGILCVQGRVSESYDQLQGYFDWNAEICASAERSFVRTCEGGCSSPIAAHAVSENGILTLRGLYCPDDGEDYVTGSLSGKPEQAAGMGEQLAEQLMKKYHNRK